MYEKIFKKINNKGLTNSEKETGLILLKNFVQKNPVSTTSPWYKVFESNFFITHRALTGSLLVLLFVLVSGGGVSLAAQSSLPGDALYPIKISLNEKLESAVAFGSEQKALVEVKHLDTRLSEAEELDTSNKLNGSIKTEVESNFKENLKDAVSHINTINASGNIENADKVSSDVEKSLERHKNVLGKILNKPKTISISKTMVKEDAVVASTTIEIKKSDANMPEASIKIENTIEQNTENEKIENRAEFEEKTPLLKSIIEKYGF